MKTKAFTLVELLGVIVILAIMIVVTAPALLTTIKNTEDKANEEFEKTIITATEAYIEQNRKLFPQLDNIGGIAYISVGTLKEGGYIKTTLVDPQTSRTVDSTSTVKTVVQANKTRTYIFNRANYATTGYVQDEMIAMYDAIDKPNGSTMNDLANKNNNLNLLGFDRTSGWDTNKIVFDGINDRASAMISIENDFTIEIRFDKTISTSNITESSLLTINTWSEEISNNPSLIIYYNQQNTPYIQAKFLANKTNSQNAIKKEGNQLQTNNLATQNNISIVKTNTAISIYLNGVLNSTITDTTFINRFNMKTMELNFGSLNDYYVAFNLRSFRVYNKALTREEINKNFNLDNKRY